MVEKGRKRIKMKYRRRVFVALRKEFNLRHLQF